MLHSGGLLLRQTTTVAASLARGIARIPHYEHHIRFDPKVGRKVPSQDVLERFFRLNNGMWIHNKAGRTKSRYMRHENWKRETSRSVTCTKEECWMLDKMVTPFWTRPKYYANDPYAPYQVRHGIQSPRVDETGRYVRERKKTLLEDSVADRYFHDR